MFGTERHPIFLLGLWGSTGAPFPILRRDVTTLFEGCILVFKNVLNAELLPLQPRLRARAVSERTGKGLLRPGHWGDPPPIRWQDVNPNPVHTKTTLAESPQQQTGSAAPVPRRTTATARHAPPPRPGSPPLSLAASALTAPARAPWPSSCKRHLVPRLPAPENLAPQKPSNQRGSDAAGDDVAALS